MRRSCIMILFCLYITVSNGQSNFPIITTKPVIDSTAVAEWLTIKDANINNDGRYLWYTIDNESKDCQLLIVRSTWNSWIRTIKCNSNKPTVFFSGDNRFLIYKKNDSLYLLQLGTNRQDRLIVSDFRYPASDSIRWFAYRLADSKELIIHDIYTNKELRYGEVINYWFDQSGKTLLLAIEDKRNYPVSIFIKYIRLFENLEQRIMSVPFSSKEAFISMVNFDLDGSQLVFMFEEHQRKSLWYYKIGMLDAKKCVDNQTLNLDSNIVIEGYPRFSGNGRWIIFTLKREYKKYIQQDDVVKVTVWSYKDKVLQPEQSRMLEDNNSTRITAVMSTAGGEVIRVENQDESNKTSSFSGDYVVIGKKWYIEPWWKWDKEVYYDVLSLKDGTRRIIAKDSLSNLQNFNFSPNGKWLVYYDALKRHYFTFELETGIKRNITQSIPVSFKNEYGSSVIHDAVAGVVGWLNADESLILYDNYDIWQVDPLGRKLAINLTNGFGLRHRIKLRLINGPESKHPKIVYNVNDTLLIIAFSPDSKFNGFYRMKLGKVTDPELLYMGPYTFYKTESQKSHTYSFDNGMEPIKASNSQVWIISRQNATEAPNLYVTKDFRKFKAVSNLQPQKAYNWITSELITWKQLDGSISQGVLYKPEDFDPNKKYPLIFNYYEQLSHRLYEFPHPGYTEGNINIPWFVSRGYLVVTPDIHFKVAKESGKSVGEWAYNSVISAVQYLAKFPYIDAKRMAIQGHSFGGLLTNYIIAHTNIFAAACEVAGNTDPISAYLTLIPFVSSIEHWNKQTGTETGHELYGGTPWELPDLYRKNSSVLDADKISTPLLIMHNERDNQVQWRQGIELYMALRRLGKKVWMLQYEKAGHTVVGGNAIDFTIRLEQFFNHYLKGELPPKWMTNGIPADQKGLKLAYDLDSSGRIP